MPRERARRGARRPYLVSRVGDGARLEVDGLEVGAARERLQIVHGADAVAAEVEVLERPELREGGELRAGDAVVRGLDDAQPREQGQAGERLEADAVDAQVLEAGEAVEDPLFVGARAGGRREASVDRRAPRWVSLAPRRRSRPRRGGFHRRERARARTCRLGVLILLSSVSDRTSSGLRPPTMSSTAASAIRPAPPQPHPDPPTSPRGTAPVLSRRLPPPFPPSLTHSQTPFARARWASNK